MHPFVANCVALQICRNQIGEIIVMVTGMMVCIQEYFQTIVGRGLL